MDFLNTFLVANVALCAFALVGFALTKAGTTENVSRLFSDVNVAGVVGAAFGLFTVSSVGAMFL